jgi:hypothetical protein
MLEKFIIDRKLVEINVIEKIFRTELINVTTHSDKWENYIKSGLQFLSLLYVENGIGETRVDYLITGDFSEILILESIVYDY